MAKSNEAATADDRVAIYFRLPDGDRRKLKVLAAERGVTVQGLVAEAVKALLAGSRAGKAGKGSGR